MSRPSRPPQPGPERRIYVLAPDLIARVRAYQREHGLPSETATVARLLSIAMSADESAEALVLRLQLAACRYPGRPAREVFMSEMGASPRLCSVTFAGDNDVRFQLVNGEEGTFHLRSARGADE